MRKTLIILLSILVGIYVVLSFLDRGGYYGAERKIYKINRMYSAFAKDPKAVPDVQVQRILNEYQDFIDEYPDLKLASLAYVLRARVMTIQKDFDGAKNEITAMIEKFSDHPRFQVQGLIELAQINAIAGNKQGIVDSYARLIKEFPLTPEGCKPADLTKAARPCP